MTDKGVLFQCPKCGHEQIRNVKPTTDIPQYCPKHIANEMQVNREQIGVDDSFTEYRYLRFPQDPTLHDIAFKFHVDYTTRTMRYAFAVCAPGDHFEKSKARALLDRRLKSKNLSWQTHYNADLSLVENALRDIIDQYAFDRNVKFTKKSLRDLRTTRLLIIRTAYKIAFLKEQQYYTDYPLFGLSELRRVFGPHYSGFNFPLATYSYALGRIAEHPYPYFK